MFAAKRLTEDFRGPFSAVRHGGEIEFRPGKDGIKAGADGRGGVSGGERSLEFVGAIRIRMREKGIRRGRLGGAFARLPSDPLRSPGRLRSSISCSMHEQQFDVGVGISSGRSIPASSTSARSCPDSSELSPRSRDREFDDFLDFVRSTNSACKRQVLAHKP